MKKYNFCNNCGKQGHLYHQCNCPIISNGIIAFRKKTLSKFNSMNETMLEQIESIDMNRVLESGGSVRMMPIESYTLGIDTVEELRHAEIIMKNDTTLERYSDLKLK